MSPVEILAFLLVGVTGTAVVAVRDPLNQAFVFSLYGMLLAVLFMVLQAPDVALSEIVVGGVSYPLMVMLALAKSGAKGEK